MRPRRKRDDVPRYRGSIGRVGLAALAVIAAGLIWVTLAGGTQPFDSYEAAVASDSPIAQLRLSDSSGEPTIADSAGSFSATNHGIVLGGEGPFEGSKSGAFGGSAYASLSNPLAGKTEFTAEAWVNWTGGASYKQPIFDFGSSTTNYMYLTPASALSGHKMLFELHTTAGASAEVSATKLKASSWEYVAVTETSGGLLTLYLDGEEVAHTTGATITPASLGTVANDYLGKSQVSEDPLFNGKLSNVAFYGAALSASRIKTHYSEAEFPVNTIAPTITGTAKDGSTLTAHANSWSGLTPITFEYQWTRCDASGLSCSNISSAKSTKYEAVHADVGSTLRVEVVAKNSAGEGAKTSAQTATIAAIKPSNVTAPAITGTPPNVGKVLTASEGAWEGSPVTSYAYQWKKCNSSGEACTNIVGATAPTFRVEPAQIVSTIRVTVEAKNSAGSATATSAATASVNFGEPVNETRPTVSGTPTDGQTLTSSSGGWAGSGTFSYAYQWQRCDSSGAACSNISGATSSTYKLSSGDVGTTSRAVVKATNAFGSASESSTATALVAAAPPTNTAAPTISGVAQDGQTLTASAGTWSGTPTITYAYQWKRCDSSGEACVNVSGATGTSYALAPGDVAGELRVSVTATNAGGSASESSTATALVAAAPPTNTAAPTISGVAQDGQTLTASAGTWSGTPTITYAYQWKRCDSSGEACVNVSGATGTSYALAPGDVAGELRVSVTATNAGGSASESSTATALVAAAPPTNTAAPTISGVAQDGQTLTASAGTWSGTPTITYAYQWQSCDGLGEGCLDIFGATESTYAIGSLDVGTALRVVVTATGPGGSVSAGSSASAVVSTSATEAWHYTSEFGAEGTADGEMTNPGAVVVASNGDLWILDTGNNRVEEFNRAGEYLRQFGSAGSGDGQLSAADGLAIDSHGDIWVLDSGNSRVQEFNEEGDFLQNVGEGDFVSPEGIAIDRNDDVWVSDTRDGRLVEFNASGELLKTVGSEGPSAGHLTEPEGLAIDSNGKVWVADWAGQRVTEFDEEGNYIGELGESGSGQGELGAPFGVAVDSDGHVWVADLANTSIDEFDDTGTFVTSFGLAGSERGRLSLSAPMGLTVDGAGALWITDSGNSRVVQWTFGPVIAPTNSTAPEVTEGETTMAASPGVWDGTPPFEYIYQWQRCDASGDECVEIPGADEAIYELGDEDGGMTLRVLVSAINAAGAASVESAASPLVGGPAPSSEDSPVISGAASSGETLTASEGAWSGRAPFSFTYQWQRCDVSGGECSAIAGAEEASYVLQTEDIGATIRVLVTATNRAGTAMASSLATDVVTKATPPINSAPPEIVGDARDGQTLRASVGSWEGAPAPKYAYQWQLCDASGEKCESIEGAVSGIYTPQTGELERTLRVVVTASNIAGDASSTSAPTAEIESGPPSELTSPEIEGIPQVHQVLQAEAGEWGGTEAQFSYQWQACDGEGRECSDITGAATSEYELTTEDLGRSLRLEVGASNALGSVVAVSAPTSEIGPESSLLSTWSPSLSGIPRVHQTLTVDAGGWLGAEPVGYGYQWQRCSIEGLGCEDISGATESSYRAVSADLGDTLRVLVSASEEHGASAVESVASAPIAATDAPIDTAAPTTAGPPLAGDTLVSTEGEWLEGGTLTYAYGWERCDGYGDECGPISEATSSGYSPAEGDAGSTVRPVVTATDAHGHSTVAAGAPNLVSASALHDASLPSIAGAAQVARSLVANPGIWGGSGSIGFAYQWQRCSETGESCSAISGADDDSYEPSEADAGHELRVLVTASDGPADESASSAPTAIISSTAIAPEDQQAPSFEGNAYEGDVLTAENGTWLSTEPISYSYQWQRCDQEGEGCVDIEAATESSYTLGEDDVEATVRVAVTASNALGVATSTSDVTDLVQISGPPANTEAPAIVGQPREGVQLAIENGQWSGSRPIHYFYRWERCDEAGEACAEIDGAIHPSYTPESADIGSTLRVNVTASNALASSSVASSPTKAVLGSESASAMNALELAEEVDPSVLAPSEPATLEERPVEPALSDPGEELEGAATLTSSAIAKDTPGEMALDTAGGELSVAPLDTSQDASAMPVIANGAAAVFADTFPDTDTIIRPDALGATALLQLRSSGAPESFSWEIGLGVDQELEQLPDGSIAVLEAQTASLEGPLPVEPEVASELELPEETGEEEGASESAADEQLEGSVAEEGPLEALAPAPRVSTPPVTPGPDELHPQDTATKYGGATSALAYAEENAGGTVLMVIPKPTVLDAHGDEVPAYLSIDDGDTVSLHVTPEPEAAYPVTASQAFVAPSDQATAAKAHNVRYGLSDPKASVFENFDPKLTTGPGHFHPGTARYVVAFNTAEHADKLATFVKWLQAVGEAKLKPYVTIGTLGSSAHAFCNAKEPKCQGPTAARYKRLLVALLNKLNTARAEAKGTREAEETAHKGVPPKTAEVPGVQLWGAWNEPDLNLNKLTHRDPLYNDPSLAARYWEIAQLVIHCRLCRVVGGEFAEASEKDHIKYIREYLTRIARDHYRHAPKPRNLGLHDYHDLVHVPESLHGYVNSSARTFAALVKHRIGAHAHILFSEQGVELQEGEAGASRLDREKAPKRYKHRQLLAAEDFLKLADVSRNVDLVDYYLYEGPTLPEQESTHQKHLFDSALRDGKKTAPADERPAYCYLVLNHHGCGSGSTTGGPVADQITQTTGAALATIEPNGLPTSYWLEWGRTSEYGASAPPASVSETEGAQNAVVGLSGLRACTTYHYRAVSENEANDGAPSYGEDKTLKTECTTGEPPTFTLVPSTVPEGATFEGAPDTIVEVSANGSTTYLEEFRESEVTGRGIHPSWETMLDGSASLERVGTVEPQCFSTRAGVLDKAEDYVASNAAGTVSTGWLPTHSVVCADE